MCRKLFFRVQKIGRFWLIRQIVLNQHDIQRSSHIKYHLLEKPQTIKLGKTGDIETDQRYRETIRNEVIREAFVLEAQNVYLVGYYSIPLTSDGKIILEPFGKLSMLLWVLDQTFSSFAVIQIYMLSLRARLNLIRPSNKIDCCAHLVARHGYSLSNPNYAHWLLENLPQIRLLNKVTSQAKILVRRHSPHWVYESLRLLGIHESDIIESSNGVVLAKLLFLPRMCYIHSGHSQPDPIGRKWVAEQIKKRVDLAVDLDHDYSKLFLSRRNMHRRRLVNHEHVSSLLSDHGFSEIFPEDLTVEEQVRLFTGAHTLVAAPVGAALANMIYMESGVVICVEYKDKIYDLWYKIASELGLKFIFIPGVAEKSNGKGLQSDLSAEITRLQDKLFELGSNRK